MNAPKRWGGLAVVLFTLSLIIGLKSNTSAQNAAVPALAPESPAAQPADDQDPPGRVAQLNYIDGSVTFRPGGENDWLDAALNRPLVTGDNLWADQNSRAELHIGSTALRLGPMTGITLLEVSDHVAQIRLVQGSLIVKVRHVDADDAYEIDTPNIAFVVMQPGDYRINVDSEGARTDVIVWRGLGEATGGGSSYTVAADQHATFTGTDQLNTDQVNKDQLNYDVAQIPGNDEFDNWALNRDQVEDDSDSANYVSTDMTGYEDLDQYGDWIYVAGYGPCWRPRAVTAGWAPYRFGHWTWIGPWGWTWAADEPWGFAPSHYGRWAFVGANWMWVPGPAAARPVYAPALVGWVGGGSARFSFGAGLGWFPLAPGEVFVPSYRVSRAYVNRVNLTSTHVELTRITSVYNAVVLNRSFDNIPYANRAVGGVTVVSRDTFINAQPVARNAISLPAKELAAVPVARTAGIEPVHASMIGAAMPAGIKPPVPLMTRQVVALRTPVPLPPSFAEREELAGGNLNQTQLVRQESPGRLVTTPNQGRQTQARDDNGLHTFNPESSGNNQTHAQPRVWEAQGDPEPEPPRESQSQGSHAQPLTELRSASQQSAQQSSHALPKPAPPVQVKPVQNKSSQQQQEQHSAWYQKSWSSSSSAANTHSSSTTKTSSPPPK